MGAGCVNLRGKRKRQQRKVGHKGEGSSLNCLKLAAFVLALRGTPVTKHMLYLCDNQALLKAVKRWVGAGGKVTFKSRRGTVGCGRQLDEDQQKRRCASTGIV